MFAKKLSHFVLPIVMLFALSANSQVITSKKEAVKKGVYQKPAEKKSDLSVAEKTVAALVDNKAAKPTTVAKIPVKPAPVIPKTTPKTVAKTTKTKKALINDKEDEDLVVSPSENYQALQMINNAMSFIGTRYHGGGTTKSGMDCSGMVTAVFNIFEMKLPRSSHDMSKVGQKVDNDKIQKGDLIFFRTNGRSIINHVGMVVEVLGDEIKFVHSSTQKGVIVSSTKEPYYKRTFAQANRVL